MADLLTGPFVVVFWLMILAASGGALFLPFFIWSAARNIKLIRMQLERLNDSLDARASDVRTGTFGR